jgi:hypothetical protein
VTTAPFPVRAYLKQFQEQANGVFIVFVVAIGFALVPASMVSHIVGERVHQLKHMQILSGMGLGAYWVSNMLFDIAKAMIPSGIAIGLLYAFDFFYDNVWRVFLLYPLGVVPFTYVSSFLFQSENVAQTVTIFTHFAFGGIGSIATLIMRVIESTFDTGDRLHKWLRVVPSFCLTNPIMYAASKDRLFLVRPELRADDLDLSLIGGDMLALGLHFIVWTIVLFVIESGWLDWLSSLIFLLPKNTMSRNPLTRPSEVDSDVKFEEERAVTDNIKPVVVSQFRRIYPSLFRKPCLAVEGVSFSVD